MVRLKNYFFLVLLSFLCNSLSLHGQVKMSASNRIDLQKIQQQLMKLRLNAGERVIGKKIGVTSKAVMNMLGVYQPDFGYLTDGMVYNEGQAIPMSRLIQPKAEGEIAFVLKKTLKGPGISSADVLAATEGVMACFEIVDSRIENWKIKKKLSLNVSNEKINNIYEFALKNGANAGKILGAGGGGFMLFFSKNSEEKIKLIRK